MNRYLIEYAINSLLRQRSKNSFIVTILTILIALLTSMILITNSIKTELLSTLDGLPSIIVQKLKGGKPYDIDEKMIDEILKIKGISSASSRVWGYYYFINAGVNFTVIGVDEFEKPYKNSLSKIIDNAKIFDEDAMLVGKGVKEVLHKNYYTDYFNFITPTGSFKKVHIAGEFINETELESNDVILLTKDLAREIFNIEENKVTDITLEIANTAEIPTIATKIQKIMPDARIITKEDLEISYRNIFDYKSGVFLGLFIISLFTFFMIVFDKTSGITSEEKKEIGILKAVGWSIEDILKEKFYEGFIISFISFILGVLIGIVYVYIFNAPILQEVFVGYSNLKTTFTLPFVLDFKMLSLIFFITVPIYIGATLFPSWKIATLESDEVIR